MQNSSRLSLIREKKYKFLSGWMNFSNEDINFLSWHYPVCALKVENSKLRPSLAIQLVSYALQCCVRLYTCFSAVNPQHISFHVCSAAEMFICSITKAYFTLYFSSTTICINLRRIRVRLKWTRSRKTKLVAFNNDWLSLNFKIENNFPSNKRDLLHNNCFNSRLWHPFLSATLRSFVKKYFFEIKLWKIQGEIAVVAQCCLRSINHWYWLMIAKKEQFAVASSAVFLFLFDAVESRINSDNS